MRIPVAPFVLLLSASALLLACGGKAPGDSCDTSGYLCYDKDSALECRLGKWRELPCRGTGGCAEQSGKVTCDMVGNKEGDFCGASAEGYGLCSPDGAATLECRQGLLVQTNTCKSCSVSGDQVICSQ